MIKKATVKDMKAVYELLQIYGQKEELPSRPLSELYDHVRDFLLYVDETKESVVGCCAT